MNVLFVILFPVLVPLLVPPTDVKTVSIINPNPKFIAVIVDPNLKKINFN